MKLTNQIFVDMDGVLADFDTQYEKVFGIKNNIEKDDVDWKKVRSIPNFYADIPPMPDMRILWNYVSSYNPIILTGIPSSVAEAAGNKVMWAVKNIGPEVRVWPVRSKEKYLYGKPGDILIDDWEKHRHRWENMGGVWITHINAETTIEELAELGIGDLYDTFKT
jgi:hypothetical protein